MRKLLGAAALSVMVMGSMSGAASAAPLQSSAGHPAYAIDNPSFENSCESNECVVTFTIVPNEGGSLNQQDTSDNSSPHSCEV